MSDDKKSSNSTNENGKVFNGELFVNNNSNDIDFDANNNSLRKSTSNSIGGSLSNNIRGSMKSNQSNGERFLTNSLMQDLRGSSKKFSDKRLEFDKLKLKDLQSQINNTQFDNTSNSNNIEEDFLANINLPKNDNNNAQKQMDDIDLYEDIENEDNEDNNCEMEEIENKNKIISEEKNEETNDIININKLTKLNEYANKNKKNIKKGNDSKGNESDDPISLRSSAGSACISSHSNNSNENINMNMRSSKIFNKKEKNSPDKNMDINNNANSINIEEGNIINDKDINQKDNIDININNENNEIIENKKENKESQEEKERKEKIANIKNKNNEQNFITKNAFNHENKNINNVGEEDKIELEMQLFNFDSIQEEKEKEKEEEKIIKENNETEINIIQNFQNFIQNLENSKQNEKIKINDNKEEEIKDKDKESDNIENNEINKENENCKEKEETKEKPNVKEMEKEEYVFEKFGKLGWECEKCNNFNFESRTICNRCNVPKQPKSLEQIKLENELKSGEKKKKPLVERKGDWQCPACHNLNFAFRISCNRCKLPKEMYLKYSMNQKKMNENMNNNINLQSNYIPKMPNTQIINNTSQQLIQNQFNIIQCTYMPIYNPYFPQNHFGQVPQQNNNINNYQRKFKFYNQ